MKYLLISLLAIQLLQGQEGPRQEGPLGWNQIPSNINRIYGRGSAEIVSNQLSDATIRSRDAAYAEILTQLLPKVESKTQTQTSMQFKVSKDSQGKSEIDNIGSRNTSVQTRVEVLVKSIPGLVIDASEIHKDSYGVRRVYTRCYLDKSIAIDSLSRIVGDIASEVRTLVSLIRDYPSEESSLFSVTAGLNKCSALQKQITEARDLYSFLIGINPNPSIFDSLLSSEGQINKIISTLKKEQKSKWIFYSNAYTGALNAEVTNLTATEVFSIIASVISEEGGVWSEEGALYKFEIVRIEEEKATLKGVSPNDFYETSCSLTLKVIQIATKKEINLPSFNARGRGGSITSAKENLKKDIQRWIRTRLKTVFTAI